MFLVKKEVGNQNFRSISLKLTELWHLMSYMGARPYMGARTKLDLLNAPDWPNCNIFWWNLFYMINRHKLHIIVELELFIYQNIDLRAKKPQYFNKIAIISKREFWKTRDGKIQTPRFFEFFSKFFLQLMHKTCALLLSELDFWFKPLFPFYSHGNAKFANFTLPWE